MHKHNVYFVGHLTERRGKLYAFRCETCLRPFFIFANMFWKGTP